jgi:hypothetical protein
MSALKSSMIVSFFALTGLLSACGPATTSTTPSTPPPTTIPPTTIPPTTIPPTTIPPTKEPLQSGKVITRLALVHNSNWVSTSAQNTTLNFNFDEANSNANGGPYPIIAKNFETIPEYKGQFNLNHEKGNYILIFYTNSSKDIYCSNVTFPPEATENYTPSFNTYQFNKLDSEAACMKKVATGTPTKWTKISN